ncbi:unnamed protein product, partial [Iphiclides podalirius]
MLSYTEKVQKKLRRLIERKRRHKASKPEYEVRSSYPLRENIWEYLQDDKGICDFARAKGKTARNYSKQPKCGHKRRGKNFLKLLIFSLFAAAFTTGIDCRTSVEAECCHRLLHLAVELSRAHRALRRTTLLRRAFLMRSKNTPEFSDGESVTRRGHVEGVRASKGGNTVEWGGRVALWGVIPLWRDAPPPDTVLARRTPKPSDCWPFSGSYGEVIIELAHRARLDYIGVEHVHPDTARSAPKNFVVYNLLENNTRLETARGTYIYNMAPKQYFSLSDRGLPVKSVAFRVLSNQGNPKYTCIYRIHLYGSDVDEQTIVL